MPQENNPFSGHTTEEQQALIAEISATLVPMYSLGPDDGPQNVLSNYPNARRVVAALKCLLDMLFPGRNEVFIGRELEPYFADSLADAWRMLAPEIQRALPLRHIGASTAPGAGEDSFSGTANDTAEVMKRFFSRIPQVRQWLIEDIKAAYNGDPAARSYAEVALAYPGVLAITSHRLAHELYKLDIPIVPRVMSEWTHTKTGADINPGATIGHGFFIDHPTGVVIGETAVIGNRVKFYQGVTIGAKSFALDDDGNPIKGVRRHPTVEDDVVVYANATILGGETVIGKGSTIGGNVFLMESVPPGSLVITQAPEPRIKTERK